MKHYGIVVADRAAALVELDRAEDESLLVTAIERLPADISAVAARLGSIEDAYVVVDGEGLGTALWAALGDRGARWTLYTGHGFERQQLVDRLLVAIHHDAFRFAPDLPEMEAMTKALVSYRRAVKEDGLIGSELVVALLLALIPPPPPPFRSNYEDGGLTFAGGPAYG